MAEFRAQTVWYGISASSYSGEDVESSVRQDHDWYQGQHIRRFVDLLVRVLDVAEKVGPVYNDDRVS